MKNKFTSIPFLALFCVMVFACNRETSDLSEFNTRLYSPSHAIGFEILGKPESLSSLIVTKTPWQGADSTYNSMLFIARNGELPPAGFSGQILKSIPKRIVCMSSTHVGMLEELDEADKVVGVSGVQFISNQKVREAAKKGFVKDIGYDNNIDYEALVSLNPDIVVLYGVNGANAIEPKLRELGVPFIYIGEYLEESPLGKAEWVVVMSELLGLRDKGAKQFTEVTKRYETLCNLTSNILITPKVMLNTPWGDSWMMPSSNSYVAQLIKDAGGDYVYKKNQGHESQPIDMEEAFCLTLDADVWLNSGQVNSIDELITQWPKFANSKPIRTRQVWNNTKNKNRIGELQYWESGCMNPDLVLRDLIKIFHPEIMENQPFSFYERLK